MSELASTAGRWVSEHRRPLTIGGVVVAVAALIIGIVSVVAQRDDPVDMQAYAVPIVSINDIPAREFIGWSQQAVDVRPQNSPVPERMSAPDNGQCVCPGGTCRPLFSPWCCRDRAGRETSSSILAERRS